MTPELKILVLAALLQVLQYAAFSVTANMQVGPKKAASPRDTPVTLTGNAGGLEVRVDGGLIAPLGEPNIVIRNVTLAPEALLSR